MDSEIRFLALEVMCRDRARIADEASSLTTGWQRQRNGRSSGGLALSERLQHALMQASPNFAEPDEMRVPGRDHHGEKSPGAWISQVSIQLLRDPR